MQELVTILVAFGSALLAGLAILSTQRLHGGLTHDSHSGVQKIHETPTPRVGGLAVLFGCIAGGFAVPTHVQDLWWLFCLAAIPAFAFGLAEDLTKRVGVKARLLATIVAGLCFSLVTGYRIEEVGVPGLDWLFSFGAFSLVFTAFSIGGIANAINIIDGVNGLASGSSIIILTGYALVAWQVGDTVILGLCMVLCGALLGFFVLNFPMGRLFLGDAGAYTTGFLLAAFAVALPLRNAELSPLMGLLALSYPVVETVVSVHRRLVRLGTHPGQADRLHLHSLVYRGKARRLALRLGVPQLRNALAGLICMLIPLASSLTLVLVAQNTSLVILGLVPVTVLYLGLYRRVSLISGLRMKTRLAPRST